jgi:HEAT repeat protein
VTSFSGGALVLAAAVFAQTGAASDKKVDDEKIREEYHDFDPAYWRSHITNDLKFDSFYDTAGVSPFRHNPTEKAVPLLRTLLADKDVSVRRYAAASIGFLGAKAKPLAPDMIRALSDSDSNVRMSVIRSLGAAGAAAEGVAGPLTKLLDDEDIGVRLTAARALDRIDRGKFGGRVLPVITRIARDNNVRWIPKDEAFDLLRDYGFANPEVAAALVAILQDTSGEVGVESYTAAEIIGKAKANVPAAAEALESALKDKRIRVRTRAACSLWQLTGKKAKSLPVLIEYCSDFGHRDRVLFEDEVVAALASIGKTDPSAIAALATL